jgi:hypothetical protein
MQAGRESSETEGKDLKLLAHLYAPYGWHVNEQCNRIVQRVTILSVYSATALCSEAGEDGKSIVN